MEVALRKLEEARAKEKAADVFGEEGSLCKMQLLRDCAE